jgi:hypothetical protein
MLAEINKYEVSCALSAVQSKSVLILDQTSGPLAPIINSPSYYISLLPELAEVHSKYVSW